MGLTLSNAPEQVAADASTAIESRDPGDVVVADNPSSLPIGVGVAALNSVSLSEAEPILGTDLISIGVARLRRPTRNVRGLCTHGVHRGRKRE